MEERTIYQKKLYRSRKNRVLGGICGGIGEYFEVDPVLIRVLSIVGAFISGGVLFFAYIISWLIIPEKMETYDYQNTASSSESNPSTQGMPYIPQESKGTKTLGVVLIIIGVFFLLDNIFPFFDFWDYWPLMLIGVGVIMILRANNK